MKYRQSDNEHHRLTEEMLAVGDTLPWDLYSPNGAMLLSQGNTIKSDRQIAQLIARGAEIYEALPPSSANRNPISKCGTVADEIRAEPAVSFMLIQSFLTRLDNTQKMLEKQSHRGFATAVLRLAMDIQAACNENLEAMIGSILLTLDVPTHLEKPLHNAIICDACGLKSGMDPIERATLVAAALTSDIGMREIQDTLFEQREPLSDTQKLIISSHPLRSRELLETAGVSNLAWLATVEEHHECVDGSGYPKGLKDENISHLAKILTIADTYTALVRPRADSKNILYQDILRNILEQRGKALDSKLVNLFINAVGLWAPGTMVLTMAGEIGLVTGHSGQLNQPNVLVLKTKDRPTPLAEPKAIVIDGQEHKIACLLAPQDHRNLIDGLGTVWNMRHPSASASNYIY